MKKEHTLSQVYILIHDKELSLRLNNNNDLCSFTTQEFQSVEGNTHTFCFRGVKVGDARFSASLHIVGLSKNWSNDFIFN